jgi:hypothetical protein
VIREWVETLPAARQHEGWGPSLGV